jgi:hypothetical protein
VWSGQESGIEARNTAADDYEIRPLSGTTRVVI